MKRFFTALGLLGSALALVVPAHAKELASLKVCGASGCQTITEPTLLRKAIGLAEIQGEPVQISTPRPAPFFRLEFMVKGDEGSTPSFLQHYVPSTGAVTWRVGEGAWGWISAGQRRSLYDRATAGVQPFGRPSFTGVRIGGRPAADPASYALLLRLNEPSDDYPYESDWIPIEFGSATPSPWTTDAPTIEYSPSENILWRGTEFIAVPDDIAGQLEARKSLTAEPDADSFPWLALLGGVGGAALVVRRRSTR